MRQDLLLVVNLPLALVIVGGVYAWYRCGFRTPRPFGLPARAVGRGVMVVGWVLLVGVVAKSVSGFFGDGRVQIAQSGHQYASRATEPLLYWGEIVGEMLLVGGTGYFLVVLGRRRARELGNT